MAERSTRSRLLALLAALFLALALCVCAMAEESGSYDSADPGSLKDSDLVAKAALVMDAKTGTVLYEKNARRKTFPASTTKIMACLVALENFPDLDQLVTVGPEAGRIPADSSKLNIREGEQYPMIDLLYGMMMRSGNDASMTVAVAVSGTVEDFVDLMNQKARELGCKDTFFVNPHGYHDEAHVSTAYDLALIARAAMENRTFREIAAARSYTMSSTSQREKWRIETANYMFVATSKYYYPALIGIKTGHHSKAGRCFVGAASRDGMEMISVVLRSKEGAMWTDPARLFDYGFTRYHTMSFSQMFDRAPIYASIRNAATEDEGAGLVRLQVVPGTALDGYKTAFLPEQLDQVLAEFGQGLRIQYEEEPTAPIMAGDILGTITMDVDGAPVSAPVIASRDVAAQPQPFTLESLMPGVARFVRSQPLWVALGFLLVLIILILIIRHIATSRERRRRRAAYERYRRGRWR